MTSRLERQANRALRVRAGSEGAIVLALLDETKLDDAAATMGVNADDVKAVRQAVAAAGKVVVVFGDELCGAAAEALSLLEGALPTSAEDATAAKQAYIDSLQRQVRSTNSPPKPAVNDNPHTYIVERPTLEVGGEAARAETKFSFVPLVRYSNSLGAGLMGMAAAYKGGKTAQAMLNAAGNEIKALLIAGEDVVAKADAATQLKKLDFLVVQEMFLTETAKLADVVLPVTSFAEAQGTQINNGMQIQFVRRVIPPVGQARPDWMVVNSLAKLMGVDFGFAGQLKNVFKEIAEKVPGCGGLSHKLLANEGATQIKLPEPDASRINAADVKERLAAELARVNRSLAVDDAPITAQAGARLKQRYPTITRYSQMLTPELAEVEKPVVLMFPA
jgi:anaerobic selenocysteine-containing dehydrogenase